MLRQLKPDSEQFAAAYPDWVEQTSNLIAKAEEGTTFGIFGAWGSGKSSGSKALQYAVSRAVRAPLQPKSSIAIVELDCAGLKSDQPTGIPTQVHGELARSGIFERNPELEKWVFDFFRKASGIAKVAMPDPLSKTAMLAIGALAEAGQKKVEKERKRITRPEMPLRIESAFIFLDDLDRCDAAAAWAILRNARSALPTARTVSVIVCDPVVLGHHVAHVLGVPLAHGFQAVLKYIDVPLKIPTAYTPSHVQAVRDRIDSNVSEDWQLKEVACEAIGSIPMRDILAALPQACLWLGSHNSSNLRPSGYDQHRVKQELKWITEVVFFIALLHICMPNAAQVMTSGKRDGSTFSFDFNSLAQGLTGNKSNSNESAIQHRFGAIAQEIIAGRMDLVRYSRAREIGKQVTGIVKVGPDRSTDVWEALWDLVRN
jgi:hypothetical protein